MLVRCGDYGASGVVIADGWVLTVAHLFRDGADRRVFVDVPGGYRYRADLRQCDFRRDLAVIKIAPNQVGFPRHVRLADTNPARGVAVRRCSWPWYHANRWPHETRGHVRRYRGRHVQFTFPAHSGDSGAGIFGESGELLAVTPWNDIDEDRALGQPAVVIKEFLEWD